MTAPHRFLLFYIVNSITNNFGGATVVFIRYNNYIHSIIIIVTMLISDSESDSLIPM